MPDLVVYPALRTGRLPAGGKKALPEPIPLSRMLGPSVVLLAVGLGSGEYVLWPNLVARYGLTMLWAAGVGLLTQFFINMEIGRWTLATGEGAVTGFCRLSRHFAWIFLICMTVPYVWPGWATGAFQCLLFAGGVTGVSHVPLSIVGLIVIGAVLTLSPKIYRVVEIIQVSLIAGMAIALAVMVMPFLTWEHVAACVKGLGSFGVIPDGMDMPLFLSALAYAGLGGAGNLVHSHYIQEKSFGMGAYTPKLASPFTGHDTAGGTSGYQFEGTEDNLRRWRGWWRAANIEHFVSFFVLGLFTIVWLALLAHGTVGGQPDLGKDFGFIQLEGSVIGDRMGWVWTKVFYLVGFAILFTTALGVLDLVGRLSSSIVKGNYLPQSTRWTESRLYAAVVWGMIAMSIVILLGGMTQPRALLIVSGCLNAMVMALYSLLLLYNNVTSFRPPVRPSWLRIAAMIWAFSFYGYFVYATFR